MGAYSAAGTIWGAGGFFKASAAPIVNPTARAIWLDASDISTMKQERTGASATTAAAVDAVVGSWLNKGTLGGWATAPTDAARPILRSDGTLYWLEFATDKQFDMASEWRALFQNVDRAMIAAALSGSTGVPLGWATNAATNLRASLLYSTGWTFFGRRLDADSGAGTTGQGADTAVRVIRGHADYANADAFLYRNGALLASNTSFQTAGSTSNTVSFNGKIGCATAGTAFLTGNIYAIAADAILPDHADIADIDAYLASKCGVTL